MSTSAKKSTATADGFSEQEREAIKQRAAELKTQARRGSRAEKAEAKAAANEADVLAKIAKMPDGDRQLAERVHAIVATAAPELATKLYYGQPGYARNGKVVCFFRSGQMDKERYSTFGVSTLAALDENSGLWPTAYALTEPTEAAWEQLATLVERAVS